jgi:hypothetical protein
LKDAPKTPSKQKAAPAKTTLKKTSPSPRKRTAQVKTAQGLETLSNRPPSPPCSVAMPPLPYHLKWHEAGIEFELHSSDAHFMGQQAWKVQQALAGLLPLRQRPYTPARSASNASDSGVCVSAPAVLDPAVQVDLGEFDLASCKAWVDASTAKHHRQEEVAQQLFPTLPTQNRPMASPAPPSVPPLPSAVEQLIQQTQQAFQPQRPLPAYDPAPPVEEAPISPIFSTLLQDLQAPPRPLSESTKAENPDFTRFLSHSRFNDITEVLLLAGEYLRTYLHQPTFGLSPLKHLVESAEAGHLNHAVLERALAQRYIEVVPDLTGNATTMEYRLTQVGRTYVQQLKG